MTVPGRLTVAADGRVTGPASIGYSIPFPCVNGTPGGSGAMRGVVMHTEVGYDHNLQAEFDNPAAQASAWFSVRDDGHITQYGPLGKGWMAWAQMAGNPEWYSIEHEDHGDPRVPLTDAQITASAQILECLSAFAGFPLQEANSITERGYGVHYMGGQAWGGHTCPDVPPSPVRSLQRPVIIELAKAIRAGNPPPALIPEAPMLLAAQNVPLPVAIPAGTAVLRFVAADTAMVSVHFHGEPAPRLLPPLSWVGGSHAEAVPAGCHAASIIRTDAGASLVSVTCSA